MECEQVHHIKQNITLSTPPCSEIYPKAFCTQDTSPQLCSMGIAIILLTNFTVPTICLQPPQLPKPKCMLDGLSMKQWHYVT